MCSTPLCRTSSDGSSWYSHGHMKHTRLWLRIDKSKHALVEIARVQPSVSILKSALGRAASAQQQAAATKQQHTNPPRCQGAPDGVHCSTLLEESPISQTRLADKTKWTDVGCELTLNHPGSEGDDSKHTWVKRSSLPYIPVASAALCYDPESIPAHPSNMIIHIQCGHCGVGRMSSSSSAGSRRSRKKRSSSCDSPRAMCGPGAGSARHACS